MRRFRSISVGDHLVAHHRDGRASHVVVAPVPEDRRDDSGSMATTTRGGTHAWVRFAPDHPPLAWPTELLDWPSHATDHECRCHLFVLAPAASEALLWCRDQSIVRHRWTYVSGPKSIDGRAVTAHQVLHVPGWASRRDSTQLETLLERALERTATRYGCASLAPNGIEPVRRDPSWVGSHSGEGRT